MRLIALLVTVLAALPASADGPAVTTLRMAAVAPDGTAWARELRAFGRDVESGTSGAVRVKWYFSAIAGDEMTVLDRIQRDQLDGEAGAAFCERLAPSLRVERVVGLFADRAEAQHVLRRLRPQLDEEFHASGYVNLGEGAFGHYMLFTREPVRSMSDLARGRYWVWDVDEMARAQYPRLGIHSVPLPLEKAGEAYGKGQIDGFIAIPTAVLAFQWSTRARYFAELRTTLLNGCIVLANRAFDQLPFDHKQAVRAAAAKFFVRFEDLNRHEDEMLVNGLFERQGMVRVPVPDSFRTQFNQAALDAREHLDDKLVPRALLAKVKTLIGLYRAEHQ